MLFRSATTQAGTLTIFLGGGVATNKSVNMQEGENGISAKVLSSGAVIENGGKPETAINAWDGLVFSLEANKSYKFFVGGTKWRLAGFRYIAGGSTGIEKVQSSMFKVQSSTYYNLNGMRVQNPGKGLYIINGKMVLRK